MSSKKRVPAKKNSESTSEETTPKFDMWSFVNDISKGKKYLFSEETQKAYDAYNINKAFSLYPDTFLHASEMNRCYNLPLKLQHDYLINSIRPKSRYAKWVKYDKKSEKHKNILAIQEYFGYSHQKASVALSILTDNQIAIIKQKLEKGGIVNESN
jgi:hypothetical protein